MRHPCRADTEYGARPRALLGPARRPGWIDALVLAGLSACYWDCSTSADSGPGRIAPASKSTYHRGRLPSYTFYSLVPRLIAYIISLGFTLGYGYWAAHDRRAERVLIPLLDILQSIPVLGFLPGLLLALDAAFPTSNIGLELAAVLMIFTGQAWNMTFSFYHSLRSLPQEQREVAQLFRFSAWQRFQVD